MQSNGSSLQSIWDSMKAKGGTGEAGVHIRSSKKYHEPVPEPMVPVYSRLVCRYYSVPEPIIEIRTELKTNWGKYHYKDKRIVLSYVTLGVLLHELAHHISFILHHRNGTGHFSEFKAILSNLFDWWEV